MNENLEPLVLMYHGIVDGNLSSPVEREPGAEIYDVSRERFSEQMKWLKDQRYRVIAAPEEVVGGQADVVITFDDGEMNNFSQALPVLKQNGFRAFFFIIAKRVGKPGYLGFPEIQALLKEGMVIGSHGLSHEILTNLNDTQIEQELVASKQYLDRNLGISVVSLSIPRGFCNEKVIEMAYRAGYKTVFISERPRDLKARCFSRIAVKSGWKLKRFEQALLRKTPWNERISQVVRKGAKKVLREGAYNRLRDLIINLFK